MKKDKTQQLITEMKEILENEKGLTVEGFVFPPPSAAEINNPGYDGGKDYFDEGETVDGNAKPFIDKIRILALQGLLAVGKQPNTPTFDLLMKVVTLCNKAVETDEDGEAPKASENTPAAPQPQPSMPQA